MSDIDLDAIEARVGGAEPGPWAVNDEEEDNFCVTPTGRWEDGLTWAGKRADAEFIAHARTDIPALVAEVRDQREVVAGLEEAVTALRHARDRQRDLRLGLLAANESLVEAIDAERDELRLEVSILQTTLREVIAAGEAHKATVERVRALVDDYEAEAAIESNRPGPNSKRAIWELNERVRDIREALEPS